MATPMGCECARHRVRVARLQRAEAAGRKVAGHAAHAERVGTVGGDGDVDDRVDLGGIVRASQSAKL